ncbi:MAG: SLC13 family permease [Armatimonadetes bacterium]|nr:SLC13 family permease [Armatimonadota bacterium]
MTAEQAIVFGVLAMSLVLFITGRWRYDIVALLALLVVTVTGLVPPGEAFDGFGHPAVITVAAVLVVSRGLFTSGAVHVVADWMSRIGDRLIVQVGALTGVVAAASAFMNNVGALALFMPIAIRLARRSDNPPSALLMPLAFGSLLGGLITLIGTPPNIIIATFRARDGAEPFRMFDFTPVGLGVTVAGVLFMALVGWRLVPRRRGKTSRQELFEIESYITEVRVPPESKVVDQPIRDLEAMDDAEITVVALVRGERRFPAPSGSELLRAGDGLVIEADSEDLQALIDKTGLKLVGAKQLGEDALGSDEVTIVEAVVTLDARIVGKTARSLNLRRRHGVNLLAVARQGARLKARLSDIRFRAGDVLLLQGGEEALAEVLPLLGCLPLAERGLRIGQPLRFLPAVGIFSLALAAAATGLAPVQIAFTTAALAMVLVGLLPLRELYESIDWPIIVLLGAMIPVGRALETTGGARLIAGALLALSAQLPPVATLTIVLVGTMFLSDLVNNAAAAIVMAPIAIGVAHGMGVSIDPFLMAVAIGASSAFLTPIGHQSNTLVMGPGGYQFGDYWRVGLPLEVVIVAVAVPLILWFWPL